MRFLLLYLVLLIPQGVTLVKGKGFKGYIFDEDQYVLVGIENQHKRFTPIKEDVVLAESLIRNKLKVLNHQKLNQTDGCPKIDKHLSKYVRQYVGFINDKSERVIWINLVWEGKVPEEELSNEIMLVFDGCSYFWNVKVNINTKEVYDLRVNGQG